jgi:hypothetical protein
MLIAMLLAAGAGYSDVVWSNNFESDTVGANPTGTMSLSPTAITADTYIKVINNGPLGSDNSLAINNQSGASMYTEINTGSSVQSALQISFLFAQMNYSNVSRYLTLSAGKYSTAARTVTSSSTARHSELRFNSRSSFGGFFNAVTTPTQTITPGTAYAADWFLNDYETSITYRKNNVDYTLGANSVALWLNGSLIASGSLDAEAVGTEGNLGRIGFTTSGAGPDFVFDDFVVTSIPEPAAVGLFMIGVVTVFVARRRRN